MLTYETGTTTPKATYSNTALTSANANPASGATTGNQVSDSSGRFGDIFVGNLTDYKAVLKDNLDNTIWTTDPVDPKTFTLADFDPAPVSFWGTTTGTSTAYELAADPTQTAYSSNSVFYAKFHTACGASPTLNIDGLGVLNLKKRNGAGTKTVLEASDVLANYKYAIENDGTDIVVLNPERLLINNTVPAGIIAPYAANSPPSFWLECNGAAISRTTYATLFAVIGTTWGVGDGSTTFNIPDFRGEFIRGWDNGKGTDSGRAFASYQADAVKNHTHTFNITNMGDGSSNSTNLAHSQAGGVTSVTFTTGSGGGGTETRPRNFAIMYCIKY